MGEKKIFIYTDYWGQLNFEDSTLIRKAVAKGGDDNIDD